MSRLTRLAAVRVSKKTTLARRVGCASCVQKSWRRVTAPSVLGQTQRVVQHFSVIGLAYYLQTWFRFNLQEWITRRSRELESKEGVYSLEAWNEGRATLYGGENGACDPYLEQVVNAEGDYRNDHGTSLSADITMMSKPLDVSQLTLEWVKQTDDPLFADLEVSERHLLFLHFAREMDRNEIAASLGWKPREVSDHLQDLLDKLRALVALEPVHL